MQDVRIIHNNNWKQEIRDLLEVALMGKNQHVTPHKEGGWQVKGENNTRATVRTDTQAKAIQRAREIARNQESELFINGKNGRIRERDSYGNDPFPPRG